MPFLESSGNFKSLVPGDWFARPEDSSIWLRLYTSMLRTPEQLRASIRTWSESEPGRTSLLAFAGKIFFGAGTIKDMKVRDARYALHTPLSGGMKLDVHLSERILPEAAYIFIAVPFRKDGVPGNEPEARRVLDVVAGLLCAHTGLNFMRECVFEGEVSGKDGNAQVPTQPQKMPQPPEGPFLDQQNGEAIAETSQALKDASQPKRGRLELALRFLDTAMRKNHGFFEYCTALEVLCDGKFGRIKARLGKLYGIPSQAAAAKATGLDVLTQWRRDYVHKGVIPPLSSDVERYLQSIFLDLMRQELDLSARGHAAELQNAVGIDLSSIGLKDNRTEEQKRARDEMLGTATA